MTDKTALSASMDGLKQKLGGIASRIPAGAPVVYLDLPIHMNVGDLLINLGAEIFFRDSGVRPRLRLSVNDYKRRMAGISREDVLVFHGGGNMNDIWPRHEELRQTVLRAFPHNRVIVMPQTVHFSDKEKGRTLL